MAEDQDNSKECMGRECERTRQYKDYVKAEESKHQLREWRRRGKTRAFPGMVTVSRYQQGYGIQWNAGLSMLRALFSSSLTSGALHSQQTEQSIAMG